MYCLLSRAPQGGQFQDRLIPSSDRGVKDPGPRQVSEAVPRVRAAATGPRSTASPQDGRQRPDNGKRVLPCCEWPFFECEETAGNSLRCCFPLLPGLGQRPVAQPSQVRQRNNQERLYLRSAPLGVLCWSQGLQLCAWPSPAAFWPLKENPPSLACSPSPCSVQSLSRVRLFATPWTAARQACLSITNSQSLLKLTSIDSVTPSNHLILCHPLLPPSIFLSISVFSSESDLRIRWPKYWSFSNSPSNEYSGLISFKID